MKVNEELSRLMAAPQNQRLANLPGHRLRIGVITEFGRTVWGDEEAADHAPDRATDHALDQTSDHSPGQTAGYAPDHTPGVHAPDHAPEQDSGLYEIGSITKTMTGLLLSIGEEKGLWQADSSLSGWDDDPWAAGAFARETTLKHLVTHTANLPRVPLNLTATKQDRLNPYANYTGTHLREALAKETPKPKRKHSYSNYGYGLLGWLLARRMGLSLEEALRREIWEPLDMAHTGINGAAANTGALSPVYNSKGEPVPHWQFQDTTAGAGAVYSSLEDMLSYLSVYLGCSHSDPVLDSAIDRCLEPHYEIFPGKGVAVGYAWMRYKEKDGTATWWHNGGTFGSSSFIAFNREKAAGFVILSNYGTGLLSQLPLVGRRVMNVDKLARQVTALLF